MTPESGLASWVRLEQTAGVGPETARKLLAAFGLPENIFSAGFSALRSVVPERIAQALTTLPSAETQTLIARTLEWASQSGNRILTLADDDYPRLLLDIPDPPILLYAKGRIELLNATSLAVVGSRNATSQGIANAGKFAETISQAGIHTVYVVCPFCSTPTLPSMQPNPISYRPIRSRSASTCDANATSVSCHRSKPVRSWGSVHSRSSIGRKTGGCPIRKNGNESYPSLDTFH